MWLTLSVDIVPAVGVPDSPGSPKCVDTSLSSISLRWDAPRRDGGNPIIGYQVEKRLKGDENWVKYVEEDVFNP